MTVVSKGADALGKVIDNVAHGRDAGYGLNELIPGMGDSSFDWGEMAQTGVSFGKLILLVSIGLGFASTKFKTSKLTGEFRPNGGPKGLMPKVKGILGLGKGTGLNGYAVEYPLGQNLLKLAPIKDSASVVLNVLEKAKAEKNVVFDVPDRAESGEKFWLLTCDPGKNGKESTYIVHLEEDSERVQAITSLAVLRRIAGPVES
ncbi:hypothetical protein BDP27DRAFT_1373538 [Rhodocollybia butyracea]|uniref:Uncharacterized protein n=1 Tax=Rhodocollybia butyracea TaxID=206335 RepID=A0A9P5P3Y6_9AGAR|nr:hypothetical protein BDP27DRAFT_1373538 [Rhodocollybia butyracea]